MRATYMLWPPRALWTLMQLCNLGIPEGGTLWLYVPGAVRNGACLEDDCVVLTATGAPAAGKYTSPAFSGPEVVLEFFEARQPHGAWGVLALRILRVMQGFGGFEDEDQAKSSQFDVVAFRRQPDRIVRCTAAATCHPEHAREAAAVVGIFAVDLELGVAGLCTGTFVTTAGALGQARYILSANHCFTSRQPDNFQYWTLVFNYNARCGDNTPATPAHAVQGVRLVFYDDESDILLLQQMSEIPREYKPYFMGFNADPAFTPSDGFAIHHPGGNAKRISFVNQSIISVFPDAPFPDEALVPTSTSHYKVLWTAGSTQGGSSGAALVDLTTRRIVGVLTGGFASCLQPRAPDYFGRLSVAWAKGLSAYLALAVTEFELAGVLEKPAVTAALNESDSWQEMVDDMAGVGQAGPDAAVDRLAASNTSAFIADGQEYPYDRPGLQIWPSVNIAFADQPQTLRYTVGLSDAPAPGEVIRLRAAVLNVPGNGVRASDTVAVSPKELLFTADNYTTTGKAAIRADYAGKGALPGGMLRFLVIMRLTSSHDSNWTKVQSVKGIFWPAVTANQSRSFVFRMPALPVAALPYHALAPIRSASGKALWRVQPTRNATFDVLLCLQRGVFLESAISMYRSGTLAWTQSFSENVTRVASADCWLINDGIWLAGEDLVFVLHDDDWFAAALDVDAALGGAYAGATLAPGAFAGSCDR
ncbi:hypothetical protein WJX81_006157 [Elliptochloris bilobata]|uniref:Peptidase S1 domain-containing protein n=1 Tax=Elliptochloris bilobata TaxID=381761 RepID=A0AAW1QJ01_9CHLO